MKILVLHDSFDGQTRRIAERMAGVLREAGHVTAVQSASAAKVMIPPCDAVIVGAAVRYGHHSRDVERMVRGHRPFIEARPNAFFSVCLSAGGPGANLAEARRYVEDFRRSTDWNPMQAASLAGALLYSRYNFLLRLVMRFIAGRVGKPTDTSRDYEYTEWAAVERFAREFAARLALPKVA